MSFPRYPEYKDSGIEWLGEVPAHWDIQRLKHVLSQITERAAEHVNPVALENIEGWSGRYVEGGSDYSGDGIAFREGDLLFGKLRPYLAKVYLSGSSGEAIGDFHVMRPCRYLSAKYAFHQLLQPQFISVVDGATHGAKMPRVGWEVMGNMPFVTPPSREQAQITTFLDHETARIDALVEEQQRLIELLKEKRQSVISHAVTKGLDPDVPMRYSGVEWLGEVPAHWEVSRLKHVTDRIIDCPHETPVYDPDGDFLVIRTADLEYGVLDPKLMYRLDEEQYNSRTRRSTLGCGDIVYGREGERWGHAALVPEDGKYCLGQRMMQFISSHEMGPEFLMWQLNSDNLYRQGDVDVVGATSPHVNVSTIRNYYISVPPEKEQLAISRFLKEESCAFDELVRSANSIVALLQERRSALISAAVTGKIDVRNWQGTAYDAYSEGEMLMAAEEYATYS